MNEHYIFRQRESLIRGILSPIHYVRCQQVNWNMINRLGLEASLQGHRGCVNCLEWDERGTYLASGSDDRCLLIWDPFERKSLLTMNTGHVANIFSVKFMSSLNENLVVTGAADSKIRVHDIKAGQTMHVFSCHSSRVKRWQILHLNRSYFGQLQRTALVGSLIYEILIRLAQINRVMFSQLRFQNNDFAEAKCLTVNPLKPS
ncbi:unnamed protein product [Heterobilharzia americana]|nr:unnamed protein product [Heterobilharzia americana]